MQISYNIRNREAEIVLTYEGRDWRRLKEVLEGDLDLSLKETDQGLGRGLKVEFYRSGKGQVLSYLANHQLGAVDEIGGNKVYRVGSNSVVDDINSSAIIGNGVFNIAPFRVVPNEDNEVVIPVSRLASSRQVHDYCNVLANVYNGLDEDSRPAHIDIQEKRSSDRKRYDLF